MITAVTTFDFQLRTRIVFGNGAIAQLGALSRQLGARRLLLVTDRGIVRAGLAERGTTSLRQAGLEVSVFDGAGENPTTAHVEAGARFARQHGVDSIVGLGGGSPMDCAKGINFLLTNGGRMQDYRGDGKAAKPMLPMIAVPTTAGTGSECQRFALIADAQTHAKMACGDPKAAPRIAILDPELTTSLPRPVTAVTGMDAISHALESAVTTRRNAVSQTFSREAWRHLAVSFEAVLARPQDLEARGSMLLGAALAGLAIEHSMLGVAHACANPLTARYGIAHGIAVGLMLPHVIRFNEETAGRLYRELGSDSLATKVELLRATAGLPARLSACGVPRAALPALAAEAAQQWTAQFNPRPAGEADCLKLYEEAF
jgi:alcohol dehydrogenase